MRFEVGVRFALVVLIAVLGISMAVGLSWGFGGVGVGVGVGRGVGIFYQQIFRAAGSEKIFEADVRGSIINALYSASGEPPAHQGWRFAIDPKDAASMTTPAAPKKPGFVTDADIDFFVNEFSRTGFAGGLNYYRNVDRNWALTPFLDGAKLRQPTLFVAGDRDAVLGFWGEHVEAMERNVPNLVRKVILPGAGHWTQQERPTEVNRLLIEFLQGLG